MISQEYTQTTEDKENGPEAIEKETDDAGAKKLPESQESVHERNLKRLSEPGVQLSEEELHDTLISTILKYHPSADPTLIEGAYQTAKEAHKGQLRRSGEPYIIHPLSVAIILAGLEMDKETIAAALLHDVAEDTDYGLDKIREKFGDEIAELVDGVTKLTKIQYTSDKIERQAENLRKMFLAMAKDIRVIIIKLSDRLHNMRTLQYMPREKQIEKARETMEIYAPIAQRLGISKIKIELEDLALKYLEPDVYYGLVAAVKDRREIRQQFIDEMVDEVRDHMERAQIKAEVDGRVKHFCSIYRKMVKQDKTIDQIYDLFAVRIIVDSVKDCYAALGVIHEEYKPIPGRFKDYIAMPKPNMYQSLHTTLISHDGTPFEVQIRTYEMHKTAEFGIAAHWKYKEGIDQTGKPSKNNEEEKLAWLRQILDWQQEMSDNKEFMDLLKSDLDFFSDTVFCFTPEGDVKNLPVGSTPIDFAYSIHSAVGNKMIGARVNDKIVNIDYQLQNGDRVEIITSGNSKGPSPDWLNLVKSSQARSKINQWFRNSRKEDNIVKGKELIDKYMKAKGINEPGMFAPEYIEPVLTRYSFKDWDSVLAAVGHGGLKEGQVVNKVYEVYSKKNKKTKMSDEDVLLSAKDKNGDDEYSRHRNGIVVKGIHDVAVKFAKCCSPVPGDDIVGFVTRGRGIMIHRTDCVNIVNMSSVERSRLIEASWDKPSSAFVEEKFKVSLTIYAENRIGLLVDISKIMSERNIDVTSLNSRTSKQNVATIEIGFRVSSKDELSKLADRIKQVDGIIEVSRPRG